MCSYANVGCNDAKEVDRLHMYSIGMSGHIPTEIGLPSLLTDVNFVLNEIHGNMPSQLGCLTAMEDL